MGDARLRGQARCARAPRVEPPRHVTGKVHLGTPGRMQERLAAEGVGVKNDKVVAWKERFWDPSVELVL